MSRIKFTSVFIAVFFVVFSLYASSQSPSSHSISVPQDVNQNVRKVLFVAWHSLLRHEDFKDELLFAVPYEDMTSQTGHILLRSQSGNIEDSWITDSTPVFYVDGQVISQRKKPLAYSIVNYFLDRRSTIVLENGEGEQVLAVASAGQLRSRQIGTATQDKGRLSIPGEVVFLKANMQENSLSIKRVKFDVTDDHFMGVKTLLNYDEYRGFYYLRYIAFSEYYGPDQANVFSEMNHHLCIFDETSHQYTDVALGGFYPTSVENGTVFGAFDFSYFKNTLHKIWSAPVEELDNKEIHEVELMPDETLIAVYPVIDDKYLLISKTRIIGWDTDTGSEIYSFNYEDYVRDLVLEPNG